MSPTINSNLIPQEMQGESDQLELKNRPAKPSKKDTNVHPVKLFSCPLVVAMVGLPARGKTFVARKLASYLSWKGYKTKVFSVSEYRRKLIENYDSHDFFRVDNAEAFAIRKKSSMNALDDICEWLKNGGEVAIFDATNATKERRQMVHKILVEEMEFKLIFVESLCDDPKIIENNIQSMKVNSPDYKKMSKEDVLEDFIHRIEHYLDFYESISDRDEKHYSYIQLYNAGEKIIVNKQDGHFQSRIFYYLSCLKPVSKTIYLSRHGESENNAMGRIGGDTDLSQRGKQYGNILANYIKSQNIPNLLVWTSRLKRTIQTAQDIDAPKEALYALNELHAGICEGMTYEEIQEQYPREFAFRDQDKYRYRYPQGESYADVASRLDEVLLELERRENVLLISHQAVLRCVVGYFTGENPDELPYINIPLHTVLKLTTEAYGCKVQHVNLPIDCVDTFREKPKDCSVYRSASAALKTVPEHF